MARSPKLAHSSGQMLVGVMISGVILGMILLAVISTMKLGYRGTAHMELKSDATMLRNSLSEAIDCDRTFALNLITDPVNQCPANAPFPMRLFDRRGNPITPAFNAVTGTFTPNDPATGLQGSARLGKCRLRVYCDSTLGSLVVRYAQEGDGPNGFYIDPLMGKIYDWQVPPIFGRDATNTLCGGSFPTGLGAGPIAYVRGADIVINENVVGNADDTVDPNTGNTRDLATVNVVLTTPGPIVVTANVNAIPGNNQTSVYYASVITNTNVLIAENRYYNHCNPYGGNIPLIGGTGILPAGVYTLRIRMNEYASLDGGACAASPTFSFSTTFHGEAVVYLPNEFPRR